MRSPAWYRRVPTAGAVVRRSPASSSVGGADHLQHRRELSAARARTGGGEPMAAVAGQESSGVVNRFTGCPHSSKLETAIHPPAGGAGCFSTATFSRPRTAAGNHVEVADFLNLAQVGWHPGSPSVTPRPDQPEPPAIAERDIVLMVIRRRTLRLIADQQRAVRQFDKRPHAMETGNDGREPDARPSTKIEIVVPVAQGKAARSLAQSEEQARKLRTRAGGDNDVFAVAVELKIDVGSCDRILGQRQPRVVGQVKLNNRIKQASRRDPAAERPRNSSNPQRLPSTAPAASPGRAHRRGCSAARSCPRGRRTRREARAFSTAAPWRSTAGCTNSDRRP